MKTETIEQLLSIKIIPSRTVSVCSSAQAAPNSFPTPTLYKVTTTKQSFITDAKDIVVELILSDTDCYPTKCTFS